MHDKPGRPVGDHEDRGRGRGPGDPRANQATFCGAGRRLRSSCSPTSGNSVSQGRRRLRRGAAGAGLRRNKAAEERKSREKARPKNVLQRSQSLRGFEANRRREQGAHVRPNDHDAAHFRVGPGGRVPRPESQPDGCSGPVSQDQTSLPASPRIDEPATLNPRHDLRSPGRHGEGGFSGRRAARQAGPVEKAARPTPRRSSSLICRRPDPHVGAMAYLYSAAEEETNAPDLRGGHVHRRRGPAHTPDRAPRRPAGDETEVGSARRWRRRRNAGRLRSAGSARQPRGWCSRDEPEFSA